MGNKTIFKKTLKHDYENTLKYATIHAREKERGT